MAKVAISIDGVLGSNVDLPLNSTVTLTNNGDQTELTYLWEVLEQPDGDPSPMQGMQTTEFQIALDKRGSYLIQLTVNAGLATEQSGKVIAAVRHAHVRVPAVSERTETGPSGWGPAVQEGMIALDQAISDLATETTNRVAGDALLLPLAGGHMTGNITMDNGVTVDGVDISELPGDITDAANSIVTDTRLDTTVAGPGLSLSGGAGTSLTVHHDNTLTINPTTGELGLNASLLEAAVPDGITLDTISDPGQPDDGRWEVKAQGITADRIADAVVGPGLHRGGVGDSWIGVNVDGTTITIDGVTGEVKAGAGLTADGDSLGYNGTTGNLEIKLVKPGKIATDAVATSNILNSAVTPAKLALASPSGFDTTGSVLAVKPADSTISVGSGGVAVGTILAGNIGSGAVTEAKIGSGAVTEGKIGTGAVTETKIGTGAVTETKIGALAVTTGKIAANAIDSTKLGTTLVSGMIGISSGKLAVNLTSPNPTLQGTNDLGVKYDGSLTAGASGLGVYYDNSTIGMVGSPTAKLAVKDGGITKTQLSSSNLLSATGALAGGGGTALSVNVDNTTTQITSSAGTNGLVSVKYDTGTMGLISSSLGVKDGGITALKLASSSVTYTKFGTVLATTSGMVNTPSTTGLAVNTDGSTLEISDTTANSGVVRVKAKGINGTHLSDTLPGDGVAYDGSSPRKLKVNNDATLKLAAGVIGVDVSQIVGTDLSVAGNKVSHGNQAGGSLHAVATTSTAGFLSSSDKLKLDGLGYAINVTTNTNGQTILDIYLPTAYSPTYRIYVDLTYNLTLVGVSYTGNFSRVYDVYYTSSRPGAAGFLLANTFTPLPDYNRASSGGAGDANAVYAARDTAFGLELYSTAITGVTVTWKGLIRAVGNQ